MPKALRAPARRPAPGVVVVQVEILHEAGAARQQADPN
jgi:hypothetical protein